MERATYGALPALSTRPPAGTPLAFDKGLAGIESAMRRREIQSMKRVSEEQVREEARRGKNEPMAKEPKVQRKQNGEVDPLPSTARKQPGTDEAKR